jgi:hypothetical protein
MARTSRPRAYVLEVPSEWIVCHRVTRDVRSSRVMCPLTRRATPIARCLECHHLTAVWNDRDLESPCATVAGVR